jgi:hypothetical protein
MFRVVFGYATPARQRERGMPTGGLRHWVVRDVPVARISGSQ